MDLRTLLRGGVTGRNDAYINEESPFAKYPLAPKNAAPLRNAPTPTPRPQAAPVKTKPLWKVPTPTARPDRPNPLQMAVDAAPYVNVGQTYAGQDRMPSIPQTYAGQDQMPNIPQTYAGQDQMPAALQKTGRLPQQFDPGRFGGPPQTYAGQERDGGLMQLLAQMFSGPGQ